MPSSKQLAERVDLACVAGDPFDRLFTWSPGAVPSAVTFTVHRSSGASASLTVTPTVSGQDAPVSLTGAQTVALHAFAPGPGGDAVLRWSLTAKVNGAGPYHLAAGPFTVCPEGSTGISASDPVTVSPSIGQDTIALTISLPGGGSGATTLDGLSDVDTTGVASGDMLGYNGSGWVDVTRSALAQDTAFSSRYVSLYPTVATVAGTTDTLAAADHGATNHYTAATLVTVTVPTDASDDLTDGHWTALVAGGAAGLTLSTTGITVVPTGANKTIAVGEVLVVMKTPAANTWLVLGGTSA